MMAVNRALEIAEEAHRGQKRRNGEPYIEHPRRVADMLRYPEDKILAALHDILEDTKTPTTKLRDVGIPEYMIAWLICLTRLTGETYFDYILRVGDGPPPVIRVKLADLDDNMRDLEEGSMKDKYRFARRYLSVVPDEGRIQISQ